MDKITRLRQEQRRLIEKIPPLGKILRTTMSRYYLTCGYKKCWCHQGEKKHGPFIYLSYTTKEKKTKMHFVPKELIPQVKEGVKHYHILWENIYRLCKINREILWLEKRR